MASIKQYQIQDGTKRYEISLYGGINEQTGNPTRVHRRGFKTKKEATLAASRLELEISKGSLKIDNNVLFSQVYREWYASYINTVRVSTYARTAKMFDNHILPVFGNLRIRTITTAQIQRAINKWFKLAPISGYKRWYHYTVNVFDYALLHRYMTGDNPAKLVTIPKKVDRIEKPENFYDRTEIEKFFKCLDPEKETEKFLLFRVLCFGGLRRGECLGLKWKDVNFAHSTITINKTLTQGLRGETIVQPPKTKAGYRTITMDNATMKYLKMWRIKQKRMFLMLGFNTMNKDQLIFANTKNGYKSLNTPAKWQNKIIHDHHLRKITVHGWRHSSCSLLFEIGTPLKEVQKRLGHDDASTTLNIYLHVTKNQDTKTAEKLSQFLDF